MALYGKQKQARRTAIFADFGRKEAAFLFCTDIAARGLDIAGVEWVVQLDCPESTETYIHRVGRTARFDKPGKAMLLLLPSETQMVAELEAKNIPIVKTEVAADKLKSVTPLLQSLCASDADLKYHGQPVHIRHDPLALSSTQTSICEYSSLPQAPTAFG